MSGALARDCAFTELAFAELAPPIQHAITRSNEHPNESADFSMKY